MLNERVSDLSTQLLA
ncbi:hypothetical protein [Citrobacter freundii]|nr:hypothetical protein [Citrobacter freundii]